MTNWSLLAPILLYLIATLGLSRYAASRGTSEGSFERRYFLGGQFMSGPLLAFALVTTYTSASSFIGGPGAAYNFGLGWVLLAMIQVPVAILTLGVIGPKIWRLAKQHQAVTILDILEQRYHSKTLLVIAGISLVGAFMGMVVVQFTGGARMLSVMTGVEYHWALALFVGTVLIYTLWGGFRAVSYTDALQGLVMVFGTVALFIAVLNYGGGMSVITAKLHEIDPALLSHRGPNDFLSWPFLLSFWVLVGFGTLGLPHTALRAMAVKDGRALKQAMVLGSMVSVVVILLPHLSGVLARAILPEIDSPDNVLPTLMITVFPPLLGGLLLAAPLAAIMSSVDSMLLQTGSTLVSDLAGRFVELNEIQQRRLSHLTMLLLVAGSGLLALNPPQMIVWLNLGAFGVLQAVFLWPIILGLFLPKANASGAISAMLVGAGGFLWMLNSGFKPFGIHPIVPALAASGAAFVLFNRLGKACDA